MSTPGLLSDFLDLWFPPLCAACREPLASSALGPFCETCADAVEPVADGCPRCGLPASPALCPGCLAHPPAFDSCQAAALFGGPVADAVHGLKYGGRSATGAALGAWLATRVAVPRGTCVMAVPLARRRRIERGYDQAALLADGFARASGLRRLRAAVRRIRDTPPQVRRSREERLRNVAGAFAAARPLAGLDVVLVDDVVTTGATASACAEALRDGGARTVRVIALARAE